MWIQREIRLDPCSRGAHMITGDVLAALPELNTCGVGLLNLFLRHTSASLTLTENASPDVWEDLEQHLNVAVPEQADYWTHTVEGPDDMPAHVKTALLGNSLTIPVAGGRLALGTWQGIFMFEHRDRAHGRSVVATLHGAEADG